MGFTATGSACPSLILRDILISVRVSNRILGVVAVGSSVVVVELVFGKKNDLDVVVVLAFGKENGLDVGLVRLGAGRGVVDRGASTVRGIIVVLGSFSGTREGRGSVSLVG